MQQDFLSQTLGWSYLKITFFVSLLYCLRKNVYIVLYHNMLTNGMCHKWLKVLSLEVLNYCCIISVIKCQNPLLICKVVKKVWLLWYKQMISDMFIARRTMTLFSQAFCFVLCWLQFVVVFLCSCTYCHSEYNLTKWLKLLFFWILFLV